MRSDSAVAVLNRFADFGRLRIRQATRNSVRRYPPESPLVLEYAGFSYGQRSRRNARSHSAVELTSRLAAYQAAVLLLGARNCAQGSWSGRGAHGLLLPSRRSRFETDRGQYERWRLRGRGALAVPSRRLFRMFQHEWSANGEKARVRRIESVGRFGTLQR